MNRASFALIVTSSSSAKCRANCGSRQPVHCAIWDWDWTNPSSTANSVLRSGVLRRQSVFADRKEDQLRVYPGKHHAAHVLGFVGGVDHRGKEGIERVLDSKLVGSRGWRVTETDSRKREVVALRQQDVAPRNGLHVVLTIDSGVQHIVEAELAKAMAKHQPLGITAIVVRPKDRRHRGHGQPARF